MWRIIISYSPSTMRLQTHGSEEIIKMPHPLITWARFLNLSKAVIKVPWEAVPHTAHETCLPFFLLRYFPHLFSSNSTKKSGADPVNLIKINSSSLRSVYRKKHDRSTISESLFSLGLTPHASLKAKNQELARNSHSFICRSADSCRWRLLLFSISHSSSWPKASM